MIFIIEMNCDATGRICQSGLLIEHSLQLNPSSSIIENACRFTHHPIEYT